MDIATVALVSRLIGSIIAIFILFAVWEWVLFKRVFDDPLKGKCASVLAAYFTASLLYGFASANGGPFNPNGFVIYLAGAAVVGFFAIRRGMKLRDEIAAGDGVADTFV